MRYLLARLFFYILMFGVIFDKNASMGVTAFVVLVSISFITAIFYLEIKSYE